MPAPGIFHERAIAKAIRRDFPLAKTRRLFPSLQKALTDHPNGIDVDVDDVKEIFCEKRIGLRPDFYHIDECSFLVNIIEVEDTSRVTEAKLRKISNLYYYLDEFNWFANLYIYDRHANKTAEYSDDDLRDVWVYFIKKDNDARLGRKRT